MVPTLPPPPRRASPAAVAAARLFIVPSRTVDDVEIAVALGGLDLTNAGVLARHRGAYGFFLEEVCTVTLNPTQPTHALFCPK